jgi:hypothetical protein
MIEISPMAKRGPFLFDRFEQALRPRDGDEMYHFKMQRSLLRENS